MAYHLLHPLGLLLVSASLFHAAGAGPLSVDRQRGRVAVESASGQRVVVSGVDQISSLCWKRRFQVLEELDVKIRARWGHMYDLYSLNQPLQYLGFRTTRMDVDQKDGAVTVVSEGEGFGVRLRSTVTVDAEREGVVLAAELRRVEAGHPLKYQLNYEVRPTTKHVEDLTWVLPGPGRFTMLRALDPSAHNVFDQDWHGTFPVTRRLPEQWALLASVPDGQGVLFTGGNLRYCRGPNRPDRYWATLYGNDRFLDKDEALSETLVIEPAAGLGGLSRQAQDCRAGIGALLTRRHVTGDEPVVVRFTGPDVSSVEAEVRGAAGVTARAKGQGTLRISSAGLADGEYEVVKRLRADGRVFEGREALTVVRDALGRMDAEAARLRGLAERTKPAAAANSEAALVRLALLRFKLDEFEAYRSTRHLAQMDALLGDAQRAAAALAHNEPAALPPARAVLYRNDLTAETDDFIFYGAGEIGYDKQQGLLFGGEGTMDMWSRFSLDGSFLVELDYMPLESPRGGTMFQMCGQHPCPNSDDDFMCTASWGSMAYYMFGVKCYHFSFSVAGRECRLRKTGEGFYILAEAPDPFARAGRWHRLAFAKDGNRLVFLVDGRMVQEYVDQGRQGPLLQGGRIGIRNWSGHRGRFRNLVARRLAATAVSGGDLAPRENPQTEPAKAPGARPDSERNIP